MAGNLYFLGSKLATIIEAQHARWRRLTNNRIDIFGGIKMDLQSLQPSQRIDEVICQGNITFCQVPPFEPSFISRHYMLLHFIPPLLPFMIHPPQDQLLTYSIPNILSPHLV